MCRHAPHLLALTVLILAAAAGGCEGNHVVHSTAPVLSAGPQDQVDDNSSNNGANGATDVNNAEPAPTLPRVWTVAVDPGAPEAVIWTADDVARYLASMGLEVDAVRAAGPTGCVEGAGVVVFEGESISGATFGEGSNDQSFRVLETRCGDGVHVALGGGGLLGRQYAGYAFLHALGVRFFHPEQEFVPDAPDWPSAPLNIERTPDFTYRSVSLHLTHPLELGDAFRLGDEDYYPEVGRYIDWEIKNFASNGKGGIGTGEFLEYGYRRGFPRSSGFSLHNQQQGGDATVDPDDPRSWQEQLTEAIEARMNVPEEVRPQIFGFTFNPSEFTELEDTFVVEELTFIADYFEEHYPDVRVTCINHGTAGEPTENYGVRYFDLPQFAPPNLGVRVHTLMFYDLFRPAPVYGNTDFNFLFEWMESQYQIRPLWYFPEAAWWLTFDIAIPLYLPITIEARHRDIQGIKFMLEGKLEGHHTFGTGHEWGYWQNEYCAFRLAADTDYSYRDCLADIAYPSGPVAAEVTEILERVIDYQARDIIWGPLLPYLVGTDPETELAAAAGISFHPLPPAIPQIMTWDAEAVAAWRSGILPHLRVMEADYLDLVERMNTLEAQVPESGRPWFDEIRDGVEVTGLRARHAAHVYGAAVTLRASQLEASEPLFEEAARLLAAADADTEAVIAVIRRREASYRYAPLERSIGGGADGDGDENWTVYKYRYLNRTHRGYYFTSIDDQVRVAIEGADTPIEVKDAVLGPLEALEVTVLDLSLQEVTLDFGDGQDAPGPSATHAYTTPEVYTLTASDPNAPDFEFSAEIAQLAEEYSTSGAARVVEPAGAALIAGLLPGVVFGRIDDARLVMAFDVRGDGDVSPGDWSLLGSASDGPLTSTPGEIRVPIANNGEVATRITVRGGVLRYDGASSLEVVGDLVTEDVVQALVDIGGFESEGARGLVASTLGFTPESLPETVAFTLNYTVE